MRISDWSSDVYSSDLSAPRKAFARCRGRIAARITPPFRSDRKCTAGKDSSTTHCFKAAWVRVIPLTARPSRLDLVLDDRKSDVKGKSVSVRVDLGGRRIIKKKKINILHSFINL